MVCWKLINTLEEKRNESNSINGLRGIENEGEVAVLLCAVVRASLIEKETSEHILMG